MATKDRRKRSRRLPRPIADTAPPAIVPEDDAEIVAETVRVAEGSGVRLSTDAAHTPRLTGGDVDAAWDQSDSGEESVGGSTPTPDQDVVDEIGRAAGVTYQDEQPLALDKVEARDAERWELDPASAEDFEERKRALAAPARPARRRARPSGSGKPAAR